jgi:type II secretory pathway pseudopilin PulG
MAILSAVAIPSLVGIVSHDQQTADVTSAVAIADAAYYTAQSATPVGSAFPITAADIFAGYTASEKTGTTPTAGTVAGTFTIVFADSNSVCVTVGTTDLAPSPTGVFGPC